MKAPSPSKIFFFKYESYIYIKHEPPALKRDISVHFNFCKRTKYLGFISNSSILGIASIELPFSSQL